MSPENDGQIQVNVEYQNDWHEELRFQCPSKQHALTHVESVYDEERSD